MRESKQIKLCVDTEYPPTCEGFTAIVDEETRGRLFYEEVSDKNRAERFVKCWNLCEGRDTDELENCVVVTKYD